MSLKTAAEDCPLHTLLLLVEVLAFFLDLFFFAGVGSINSSVEKIKVISSALIDSSDGFRGRSRFLSGSFSSTVSSVTVAKRGVVSITTPTTFSCCCLSCSRGHSGGSPLIGPHIRTPASTGPEAPLLEELSRRYLESSLSAASARSCFSALLRLRGWLTFQPRICVGPELGRAADEPVSLWS